MPNASIPTPQPVKQRKMFGAYGKSPGNNSVIFVSKVTQILRFLGVIEHACKWWFMNTFMKIFKRSTKSLVHTTFILLYIAKGQTFVIDT